MITFFSLKKESALFLSLNLVFFRMAFPSFNYLPEEVFYLSGSIILFIYMLTSRVEFLKSQFFVTCLAILFICVSSVYLYHISKIFLLNNLIIWASFVWFVNHRTTLSETRMISSFVILAFYVTSLLVTLQLILPYRVIITVFTFDGSNFYYNLGFLNPNTRLSGIVGNPIDLAVLLPFWFVFFLFNSDMNTRSRLVSLVVYLYTVFLNNSRFTLICSGLILIVYFLFYFKAKVSSLVLTVLALVITVEFGGTDYISNIFGRENYSFIETWRVSTWKNAWEIFVSSPFIIHRPEFRPAGVTDGLLWSQIGRYGIFGFIPTMIFFIMALKSLISFICRKSLSALSLFLVSSIAVFSFLVNSALSNIIVTIVLFAIIAYFYSNIRKSST